MADLFKPVALTGNAVVDSLIIGGAWNAATLTYGFKAQDIDANGIDDFDEGDWKAFYKEIYDNVSGFAAVDFVEGTVEQAQLIQRLDVGGGGESGTPSPGVTSLETAVGINPDSVKGAADVVRLGTYSETWIHEIGHSLGLGHPHDGENGKLPGVVKPGDFGTGNLNSQIYTVMGYTFAFWGEDNPFTPEPDENTALNAQPGSFGAIDIAALQHLYGARAHNTGNDVYRFSDDVDANRGYTTIWDTGGSDTIAYDGSSAAKIDLRAATLKAEIGGGGWLSTSETLTGGVTIANGVSIETARGGSGDDILIGNDGANRLDGGQGSDRMSGGLGNDTYVTDGLDTIEEAAGSGTDRVLSSASHRLGTYVENLKLLGTEALDGIGNARANVITGNGSSNMLTGGAGNDVLTGGAGEDTFLFRTKAGTANTDHIRDFSLADDVIALSANVFAGLTAGPLSEASFKDVASGSLDADDRVLYDRDTGLLSYDADGSGAGTALAIAVIDTKAALTFADVLVV
ncbi:hypothetical protein FPV16_22580 [Methylobacterium sp. W2]|uniref:M10 family metallopeptidase C-terminal domain-containing protein n=1 Tax=Methylobacterium sp. W2 TaxID=2598107 RepID=UPI001D0CCFA9|nr:M10 family metallopeptidase C-terminal domain-containing protein [Methylobacterium sp. W2]MCC0808953.1 hypothetical protein [Methylobacterium sp. W2]